MYFNNIARFLSLSAVFAGYHLVKYALWHRGIGAHFFHRTRYMTFPVYLGFSIYIIGPKNVNDLKAAGLHDYQKKRFRFIKHTNLIDKLVFTRKKLQEERMKAKE